MCGMELGTAYSEMIYPLGPQQRFMQQSFKVALGDVEAMEVDEVFGVFRMGSVFHRWCDN